MQKFYPQTLRVFAQRLTLHALVFWLAALAVFPLNAAANMVLDVARVTRGEVHVHGVHAEWQPQSVLVQAAEIQQGPKTLARSVRMHCAKLQISPQQLACAQGSLAAELTKKTPLTGDWSLLLRHKRSAEAQVQIRIADATFDLSATLADAAALIRFNAPRVQGSALLAGAAMLPGVTLPAGMALDGELAFSAQAEWRGVPWLLKLHAESPSLTASETSGKYASDKLAWSLDASGQANLQAASGQGSVSLALSKGQLYLEPLFNDFGPAPANLTLDLDYQPQRLQVRRAVLQHQGVAQAEATAEWTLQPLTLVNAEVDLQNAQLPGFFERYIAPWLAGKPGEDLQTNGVIAAKAQFSKGTLTGVSAKITGADAQSAHLNSGIKGLAGALYWQATESGTVPESRLTWQGGNLGSLPLVPSQIALRAQGDGMILTEPFRQPVLDGALRVDRLRVADVMSVAPSMEMQAEIEPIDLNQLSAVMGWPLMGGQIAGKLPGLRFADHTLEVDGALAAQVFDGSVVIDGLRWVEPFSRAQRLAADVRLRRIDLAKLTGAFSFGRIEGRMDGDITGLKLLGLKPVAFNAHMYTSPKNPGRRRISQRAIDNISSLGGGPKGILSKGVMSFFEDFGYQRIGWSCLLQNGVCLMDGVRPSKDDGYVLVEGSLLPRIDVIGHPRRVDWNTFYAQLKGLTDLQTPETGVQVGR